MKPPSDTVQLLLGQSSCCAPSSSYYPSFPPFLHAVFFPSTPAVGLLTERLGHIHMSHRFTEIPIVFSQCAPLRGPWVACVSQRGPVHPNLTPHHFTQLSHTTRSHLPTHTPHMYICISPHTLSHTMLSHLNLATCHSVQTGPSTNSTIWLTRRPLTDLFHNLGCSVHCIGLLW